MRRDRRGVLGGAVGLAALGGLGVQAQPPASPSAPAPAPAPAASSPWTERLSEAARAARLPIGFDGRGFSGAGFDRLLAEGRAAQAFAIGEEHGIAENPALAAALFRALAPSGYRRLVVEISPVMAAELDRAAARGGLAELRRVIAAPESAVAFFGMRQEAEMLTAVRAAVPAAEPAFWGVDYDIAADRRLLSLLEAAPKPPAAAAALAQLRAASRASWARYDATRDPRAIFGFSGDPARVRAVQAAWPRPDARSAAILRTLEETLQINRLFFNGQGWESNRRRSARIRAEFLRHWRAEPPARRPRIMLKMGSSHLVRGQSNSQTFDLGTLLPELLELEGARSFSMMVIPGRGSPTAVLDPSTFRYAPAVPKDDYARDLGPLIDLAFPEGFTLFDLRPLRAIVWAGRARQAGPELVRTIHGYDALLVMTGSTPSTDA